MRSLWVQLDVPGLHVLAMEQADQPRFEPQISWPYVQSRDHSSHLCTPTSMVSDLTKVIYCQFNQHLKRAFRAAITSMPTELLFLCRHSATTSTTKRWKSASVNVVWCGSLPSSLWTICKTKRVSEGCPCQQQNNFLKGKKKKKITIINPFTTMSLENDQV